MRRRSDLPAFRRAVMRLVEHVPGDLISYNEVDLANETLVADLSPPGGASRTTGGSSPAMHISTR